MFLLTNEIRKLEGSRGEKYINREYRKWCIWRWLHDASKGCLEPGKT